MGGLRGGDYYLGKAMRPGAKKCMWQIEAYIYIWAGGITWAGQRFAFHICYASICRISPHWCLLTEKPSLQRVTKVILAYKTVTSSVYIVL